MALQVWLPLNGSIENQGLLGSELITNGPEINYDDGKLGKALHRGGLYMTAEQTAKVLNNQEVTICFWIYVNADTGSDNRDMLFGNGDMSENANRKFSLFQYPTCNDFHYSFMNDAANVTFAANVLLGVLPSYKWTHVAMVYKNPTIKIFINGELRSTETDKVSSSSTFAYTTQVIYDSLYHKFNDYRLYDNALSDREIHEIAKGLVVHYPLNDVYCTGSSNLYSGEYAEGKCSHGSITPTKLSGERGYNYKLNYTGNGNNSWPNIGWPRFAFTVGKTYDYSMKVRCHSTNGCYPSLRASRCCNDWVTNAVGIFVVDGKWHEYHVRQTIPASFERSGTVTSAPELEIYFNNLATNGTVYSCDFDIKDVQVCEANTSVEFADGSFNTNIVYDVSGFGNHGVRSGKLYIDSDTPRNDCCYNYNQTGYIHRDNFETYFSQFTIAYWVKIPSSITAQHFICGTFNNWTGNGFGAWRDSSAQNGYSCIMKSTAESSYGTFKADGIPHNTWTHIAYMYTETQIKTYINGSLIDTKTYGSNGQCYMPNLFLGNSTFGNRTTENDEASMSDFRLYATALSDKDIAELYNTPMCITNNGALMTQGEFKEV